MFAFCHHGASQLQFILHQAVLLLVSLWFDLTPNSVVTLGGLTVKVIRRF